MRGWPKRSTTGQPRANFVPILPFLCINSPVCPSEFTSLVCTCYAPGTNYLAYSNYGQCMLQPCTPSPGNTDNHHHCRSYHRTTTVHPINNWTTNCHPLLTRLKPPFARPILTPCTTCLKRSPKRVPVQVNTLCVW